MIPLFQQLELLPSGAPSTSYYVDVLARRAPNVSLPEAAASLQVQRRIVLEQSVPLHHSPAGKLLSVAETTAGRD